MGGGERFTSHIFLSLIHDECITSLLLLWLRVFCSMGVGDDAYPLDGAETAKLAL